VTIDLERCRLRTYFRRAMVLAIAGGAACGTKGSEAIDPSAIDAGAEGGAGGDAQPEASADAGRDGPPDKCAPATFTPDPPDPCGDFIRFPCGLPQGLTTRGACYFGLNDCAAICPDIHYSCRAFDGYCADGGTETGEIKGIVVPDEAGAVVVDCSVCPGNPGRAPAGLASVGRVVARSYVGGWLAAAAHLEAASVYAFRRLGAELAEHEAPEELVRAARDAERDEARHALAMSRLARRYGGRTSRPRVGDVGPRALEAIARENAVEGCVRETFAALVACWQAENAPDPDIARAFEAIAEDETRHAALSWAVARWADTKLDQAARGRIAAAQADALAALASPSDALPDAASMATLGLPSRDARATLARGMRDLFV
jgi:rubrerythrin